jgi:hypothetical protein
LVVRIRKQCIPANDVLRITRLGLAVAPHRPALGFFHHILDEVWIVLEKKRKHRFCKINPGVQIPLLAVVMEVPFPESCMEDLVLEGLNVSKAILAPCNGDCFSLVVSHTFTLRISISCGRFVERDCIRHARTIFQAANVDGARRKGMRFRRTGGSPRTQQDPANKSHRYRHKVKASHLMQMDCRCKL